MHILLTAATPFEVQPTIDYLASGPAQTSHLTITPLVTGVGSLPTTWSLMRQIGRERPRLIIQAGIAGCFTDRKPGEVVAVGKETLADIGVWEDRTFKSIFDLRLAGPDSPPFTGGQLINPWRQLLGLTSLDPVPAVTVNEITTDPARISWYQQNTGAVVESMEGGALHFVCLQENIPFIQLRAISNEVGVRDKTKWDIRSAIASLNTRLTGFLEKLNTTADTIF
ncbi:futalosine hydrolase [Puia sp. P3]|uniref:futalosine hydrolase n=1 Tax=Puia sp. P3 TaxID=3423952 RepID=UPI003D670E41